MEVKKEHFRQLKHAVHWLQHVFSSTTKYEFHMNIDLISQSPRQQMLSTESDDHTEPICFMQWISKRTSNAHSCNHCCSRKSISIACSERVFVALVVRHAMCMRHIVICDCPALQHFSTLSHKRDHSRGEKKLLKTKYAFSFSLQLLPETRLSLRRTERDTIINVCWSSCWLPVILVRFTWDLNPLDRLSKNTQIPKFTTNRSVGADCSTRTDGRTDGHEDANSCFSQFCKLT